jgi:hydroxymethylpyrimidine pyrophosphatase-like HAD family hydrolase
LVKDILRILNIDLKDIIAFGDDYNDLEMLVECGRGVAMGNAPDEIKKIVGCCTLTNDEDGVAAEIENILDQMK